MAFGLVDGVSFTAASSGTGSFVFGSSRASFRTLAQAVTDGSLVDGQTVAYLAQDSLSNPTQREWGHGTYTNSTLTVARTTILGTHAGGTSAVNFSVAPIVSLTALAEDLGTIAVNFNETVLYRDAVANTLAIADGTNAAALRIYNTTDQTATGTAPTNYERLVIDWTTVANTLTIGQKSGGTGSGRQMNIAQGVSSWIGIAASNNNPYIGFLNTQGIVVGSAVPYGFSSGADPTQSGTTLQFNRQSSGNNIALNANSGTSGFRIYNTTDDSYTPSNYERSALDWTTTSNVLTIGTQAGGTGTGRAIQIVGGPAKATSLYNFGVAPTTKTTNYTVVDGDQWLIFNGAGSITVTLPAASSYTGREITMKTIAAQTVVSASSNVAPASSATAGTAILAATAGKFATLVSDGTNWIIMQSN